MIEYRLLLASPESHQLQIELHIENPDPQGQVVYLSAWIRGSYMIRDFARNIIMIEAFSDNTRVLGRKLDKQTWQFDPTDGPLTIRYWVYAWELSVRAAHFDTTHAYFNGACLFLAAESQEHQPCRLRVESPDDPRFSSWRIATGMPAVRIDSLGFGDYESKNYEALMDYPFEIGEFKDFTFNVSNKPHRLVVSGMPDLDLEPVCKHLEMICTQQVALFGELPVDDYHFLLRIVGDGYGGLEHRNSTSLIFPRSELFARSEQTITSGYRRLLALCSHEYFHLWNVKRITPEVFQKNGTTKEVYTRQLWIFEGITSYYDELMLVRSGVIEAQAYFEMLAETVTRVMRSNGRTKQTLEESSFDAWTKFYKQDENAPNALVSYYAKGALLALVIDLTIRLRTSGQRSLDDVMRYLWTQYGKLNKGLPEGVFENLLSEVSGVDLHELLDLGLRTTRDLPLDSVLESFGVNMKLVTARSSDDLGGVAKESSPDASERLTLGA
ncbi:MAG: peptidase M61 [Candidatus Thiodiazotropha sp.]